MAATFLFATVGLIRFRGHVPKGGYDVQNGILSLKARDIKGYSTLQFVVRVPVVLFLVWILT